MHYHIVFRAKVSYGAANEADFKVLSSTELNFRPGVTTDKIIIETIDDSIIEGDEKFFVTLSTADHTVLIDNTKEVTSVTITDNDHGKCMYLTRQYCATVISVSQIRTVVGHGYAAINL